jgi:hypothetical protein
LKEKIEIQRVLNSVVEGANLELSEYLQFFNIVKIEKKWFKKYTKKDIEAFINFLKDCYRTIEQRLIVVSEKKIARAVIGD